MVEDTGWPKEVLRLLLEGKLEDKTVRDVQRKTKDDDRFEKILEVEQERVPWKDKIILPLQEHLYIVQKGTNRLVKCFCGYEFGDYRKNWKLSSLVYERDPSDGEIHVGPRAADPNWMVLREFYCPGCGTQLDIEAVPPGHPFIFSQEPDIDAFYAERPLLAEKVFGKRS